MKKLTEEAWDLYLKILDIERVPDFSIKLENRIYKLTDQSYYRYARRRDALGLRMLMFKMPER
ncbi:MAG: hypothetical protein ACXV8O_15510 [Methylobacter sp.]